MGKGFALLQPGYDNGKPAGSSYDIMASAHHRHCLVMKVGNRIMIAGAAIAIVGVLGLATPWAKDHDPGTSPAGTNEATSVIVGGISFGLVGVALHVIGQEYEDKHPAKLSVATGRNKVGVAWNF